MDLDAEFKRLRLWQADVTSKMQGLSSGIEVVIRDNQSLRSQVKALTEKISTLEPKEEDVLEETKGKKDK